MHDSPGLADTRFLAAMPDYRVRRTCRRNDAGGAWYLWQGVPVLFVKLEEGGFEWSYSHSWAKRSTVISSRRLAVSGQFRRPVAGLAVGTRRGRDRRA